MQPVTSGKTRKFIMNNSIKQELAIEKAVDNMVFKMSTKHLMDFVFEHRLIYFNNHATVDEINDLLREHG